MNLQGKNPAPHRVGLDSPASRFDFRKLGHEVKATAWRGRAEARVAEYPRDRAGGRHRSPLARAAKTTLFAAPKTPARRSNSAESAVPRRAISASRDFLRCASVTACAARTPFRPTKKAPRVVRGL